jgi:hypothetical protein
VSDLVPTEDIERIVGASRHHTAHYGRAVSAEETVYILHSKECLNSGIDLRECQFSIALDRGISIRWDQYENVPVELGIVPASGRLVPMRRLT